MRIYIEGTLSEPIKDFYLSRLFFGDKDTKIDYETDAVNEYCFSLEGDTVDTCVSLDGTKFSSRWKGVTTTQFNKDKKLVVSEDGYITVSNLTNMLINKKLVNGEACFDNNVICKINDITIEQYIHGIGTVSLKIDKQILDEGIKFII